jgi:predicted aspartyl protease
MVVAFIGVSAARREALVAEKQPIPNIVQVSALIDTGASGTCIDPSILKALKLSPSGKALVNTPTTGTTPELKDQYDVSIFIPGTQQDTPLMVSNLAVIEAELLTQQNIHALIGRDVLALCLLAYNGKTRTFSLAY